LIPETPFATVGRSAFLDIYTGFMKKIYLIITERFRNLSYRNRLLFWVMPVIVLGLNALGAGSYWYLNNLVEKELTASMQATTLKAAENINTWFKTLLLEPETIASTPAAKAINTNFRLIDIQNINRHKMLHEKYSDIFLDIYAANRNGEYHSVREQGNDYSMYVGDISNRDYFKSIMAGGPAQITPPLISRATGIPTIFIVAPIKDERNRPQGLIGAGISLEYVQKLAESLKASKNGYGIVIAGDGTFIYHPNKDYIMKQKATEFIDPSASDVGKMMILGGSGMQRYTLDGMKKVAFYQSIPIAGWSVATVVPEDELFLPVTRLLRTMAVLTLVIVIIAVVIILKVSGNLTRPLLELASHAREIASGNLQVRPLDIKSNDEIGILANAFDVMTDNLKNTLKGLRDSEEKFRGIFENAVEGIFQSTAEGYFISANPSMAAILGYDNPETLINQAILKDIYTDPMRRDELIRDLLKNDTVSDFEAQIYRKDGETVWVLLNVRAIKDNNGKLLYLDCFMTDITKRKKAEEALLAAQDELLRKEKLSILGQLAGTIGHELRNPLGVMNNVVFYLKTVMTDADDTVKEYLDIIQHEIDDSRTIITDLLDFARTRKPVIRMVMINELIDDSLARCTISDSILMDIDIQYPHLMVNVDPFQMAQVFQNLITNAIQAMPEGGKITISVRENLEAGTVSISFTDTGTGISADGMKRLFQPLFTTKIKGIGLGLTQCKNLTEANGGGIDVVSTAGKGATFTVILPVADTENGLYFP
jgi:PAS domain S-box-containing protein